MLIRKLPPQESRVETGPVQFGDDWPGVFIQGDNALVFMMAVDIALQRVGRETKADMLVSFTLDGLRDILQSALLQGDTAKAMGRLGQHG